MGLLRKSKVEADERGREALDRNDPAESASDKSAPFVSPPEGALHPEEATGERSVPEPSGSTGGAVSEAMAALAAKVDQLADRDDRENRMYEDLRKLREGDDVVRSLPLFRSVIQVIDRVHGLQQGAHDLAAALPQLEEELVELLERYGIEQIERSEADGFDASLQKAIGQLGPESEAELEIVGAGYSYGDRIIRHQQVMVRPADRPAPTPVADRPLQTEP